ncbi:MAG: M81 family metallopeptidase [Chloroflexi bacterium]|nr:M81 family metallopeptidase [Chloroflexota bacterium]
MPKILVAECRQEVSSFNPVASHYGDFIIFRGADLLTYHRRTRDETGGACSVFDPLSDIVLVPTLSARAITSGGTLAAADWQRVAAEFLDALRAAPPVDGVYFSLHGAMSSEGEDDPEGYLLQEARKILGERVPIVVSLDLHGILTDRMMMHSDAIVVYHTYPHVDFFETGARAAKLLLRIMAGEVKPVMASVAVPALVRGDEMITATGSIRHVIQAAQAIEASAGGLSAGMFWGNPFTDVPDLRSNSLVVTDGDAERAGREAANLADMFWEYHERMRVPLTSLADAARIACETTTGTTVLVDAADAPSSGASGDSNAMLRALIDAGYKGRALLPIVDPPAVAAAFKAGVGATIDVTLGGALDPARYTPLPMKARVRMLSDGDHYGETTRALFRAGHTAVLACGNHTIIATTRPVSLYDRSLFYAHGQDPQRFDCVVVKSPHCEHHMFKAWAARYVDVDAPGATSANLKSLGHVKTKRPVFPLDGNVAYKPKVKIFQRKG